MFLLAKSSHLSFYIFATMLSSPDTLLFLSDRIIVAIIPIVSGVVNLDSA